MGVEDMAATLAQALTPAMVDSEQINEEFRPLVYLVKELIGVIPNCNPYLGIWPPAFRILNVLVPNLLNLPASLVGQGAPKELVGLAMYASSRESGCMYCTAHHCSFAIRRGAAIESVVDGNYTPAEAAIVDVAEAVARVPVDLAPAHLNELEKHLSPAAIEWVILAVAMGGFLNKFMDTMGIELEYETIADIEPLIGDQGWSPGKHQWLDELPEIASDGIPTDNFRTLMRVVRRAPGAIKFDAAFTKGVSGRLGPALLMLEDRTGYSFPILASLTHKRAVKAIATALRDSLDAETTQVGLAAKCMVALVYAKIVEDEVLTSEAVQLADGLAPDLDPVTMMEIGRFARCPAESATMPSGLSQVEAASVMLAKAGSTSPSSINEFTVEAITEQLTPAQIVEVVAWLGVLQMLHRLYAFYDARIGLL
ncbi:MAG: carboxymuconolactone decarboxylase family protein [Acidimicrobiales bacterium]